jgi:aminopeptidase N
MAKAAYTLEVATALLPYFNEYFGTPYPLPKLDLVAGPGSSQFFAMENWGAIFFFEKYLLIDPRISTLSDRQWVFAVVAHEIAHQWFGNLVTMAWWDDLWLNEGFASWMANKAGDHFHPEWKWWLSQLVDKQAVMERDARDGTHPIVTAIEDATQANNAFDDIAYSKGAAVIRALEDHVGEAPFRNGVRRYIREHLYANTVTDDLWNAIAKETAAPVPQIAHDLTRQAGVPLVGMLRSDCENGKTRVLVNQTNYAIDPGSTTARVWALPLKAAVLGQAPTSTLITGSEPSSLVTPGCGPVLLNTGQSGYLRVLYTPEGMSAIRARYAELIPDDQLGVLQDTMSLAMAGYQPMAGYLDLVREVPANADPVVAYSLLTQLMQLDRLYRGSLMQPRYRTYARGVLRKLFAVVGWNARPGEDDNTAIVRTEIISALNDLGDPEVVAENRTRFDRYLAKPASFDAETRSSVLRNVAARADDAAWERLRTMAKNADSELERREFFKLLGSAHDPRLAQRALALVLSEEIPTTLRPDVVASVAEYHPDAAVDFAIQHWPRLSKSVEVASAHRFLPSLATHSADLKTVDKLDRFAATHVPANARQDFVLVNARVRYQAKVRAERLPEVDQWLTANLRN